MVNVTSIYNVNASIRRLNAHNFGHPWLHIIDDIDLFGRKLYNGVVLYPRHANALLYKGVPDFVAVVGIGPFEHNSDYVAQGEPAAHLTGELRFLASRMAVVGPPLPYARREEFKLSNDFIEAHPSPKSKDLEAHCKTEQR